MIRSTFHALALASTALLVACPARTPPPKTVAGQQPGGAAADAAARTSASTAPALAVPPTRREGIVDVVHGQRLADPYRWLEQMTDETRAWLMAQDRVGRGWLAKLPGRAALAARLKQLSYIDWISAPERRGSRYFFARQHADKEKVVYYWREGEAGEPKVLLDPNTMSKDGSVSIHGIKASYDGKTVAYKLSENNADQATLYVMDVASGKVSKIDTIAGAKYADPSWTPRGDGFYYTRLPTDKKIEVSELPGHAAIYFHKLGQDPRKDRLVRQKTGDPRTFQHAQLSRDGHFLLLYVYHGWTSTDVYFKDLRRGRTKAFRPFAVGLKAKFEIFPWKDQLYVQTNLDAPRWRMMRVSPRRIDRKHWQQIVAEREDAVLEGFSVRGGHLALTYLRKASTELQIARLDGKVVRTVEFPGLGTSGGLVGNPEDDVAYYSFSSFIQPSTIYNTSIAKGGRELYFETKVPFDPKPYTVEQVSYPSKDGTPVTMFIIRRRDRPRDGSTPFLLTGYGGFNISITPQFRADYFTWLEQGAGIAIPNLRGGGEYGEKWHEAGMRANKQNVFDDFTAAAEFLIAKGYTRAARLAIRGGSNGGLLVGAAMTQRPELFRAVACHVPLLDMVRYHLFGSGKTWISEYGSAEDAEQFKTLLAYSPYQHVKEGTAYPSLLMLSADSDDRVDPMHARKFTAAIQHASSSGRPVLMRVETNAGHGGGDMIKKTVEARTDEFAFLLHELGVTPRNSAPKPQ